MSTDTATRRPANEEILAYLDIRQGRTALHPENITTVITLRDGREVEATLRTSDLLQVLAERREAIERLSALTADARLYLGNSGKPLHPARMGGVREDFDASIGSQEAWLSSIESEA